MSALAVLLIAVISLAWVYPERLGRWLRKVWNGFGPINVNKHVHIDAATVAALRAALRERE
ncbi:hypothetical protein CN878_02515 [Ochrobactrum sp. 695/2009]|uniref:hypothetical protein n=1 Tax=Brucella pseudintermedia TaxID=370111 RepID=UPI000C28C276|nr:hypothetical protein [Brucella intermedia]PJR91116.1 hypothetical protein CN881_18800 [Ochrobactrum sp. 721/2009]PJT15408.1 hypothetical protein CN880_13370 [Ochrobactrum sp. 720/2009]PJT19529.1 hypothetical protein CN879_19205 [Ochrobactrum sp. 715/2009]PJT30281.1 hypothetical protein CN878_02515 [Ochrobactrum sp. 695/2009]PJT32363.1 hypothetical protein CN877_21255 [Ochrobactrum sp. 689/2009]WPM80867.1 hypothetical protein R5W60_03985 [Brucella pseudintermedia]